MNSSNGPAVRIEALRKSYSRGREALRGLDFSIGAGRVCGFVGPNGAGKTTTINILVGLVRPTSGTVVVFGSAIPDYLRLFPHRIGVAFDSHPFVPTFSAERNLSLLAALNHPPPTAARIEELLHLVGLADRKSDSTGSFSRGMIQRLSVASALLHDPDLVVLDEPFSGLDPVGAQDLKQILRFLRDQGKTILVSSHQLSEVEAVCDDLAVIRDGRIVYEGPLSALLQEDGVSVTTPDLDRAAEVVRRAGWECEFKEEGLLIRGTSTASVNEVLVRNGVQVLELKIAKSTLEDAFFDLL